MKIHPRRAPALTLARAEAEPAVSVEVASGAAPGQVVRAALRGAGGVGAALEGEGEATGGSICVSETGPYHCKRRRTGSGGPAMRVGRAGNGGGGGSGSHRRPCPETTAPRRRSGRLPGCPGQGERRAPGARPSHRRDIHLRALRKEVGGKRRVSRGQACRLWAAQRAGLRAGGNSAVRALCPLSVPCRAGEGAIGASGGQGRWDGPEEAGRSAPSALSVVFSPPSPSQTRWAFPFSRSHP